MSGYGLTYRSIVGSNKLYHFEICSNFHIHEKNLGFVFSLQTLLFILFFMKYIVHEIDIVRL
jgi:hypothetical protein